MTENTVVNESADNSDAKPDEVVEPTKVIPDVDSLGDEDDLAPLIVRRATKAYATLTEVAAKQEAGSNVGQLMSEALKSSDNTEVQTLMGRVAKAHDAINGWIKAAEDLVRPTLSIPSEEELKALDESYKALVSKIKTFDNVFTSEVKEAHPELTIYDYIGELPKSKRGGSTGAKTGQGEGSSRPRVSSVEVSTDNGQTYEKISNKDGKSTFSALVQWIKKETGESVGASDLHEPWLSQNGQKEWSDLPEVTTFNYSLPVKGKESVSYFIRVSK